MSDIICLPGYFNHVAHSLSRAPVDTMMLRVEYTRSWLLCNELLRMFAPTGLPSPGQNFRTFPFCLVVIPSCVMCLLASLVLWFPPEFGITFSIICMVYLTHRSETLISCMVGSQFMWCGLWKDVASWTRSCVACQSCKIHRHQHAPFPFLNHHLLMYTR